MRRTRSTTAGYGVPSGTRSRCRKRRPERSERASRMAIAVGSDAWPRSTPTRYRRFRMALPQHQGLEVPLDCTLHDIAVEDMVFRVLQCAQVLLEEAVLSLDRPLYAE